MQNKEKQEAIEKAKKRAHAKASVFSQLFSSPVGKEVLTEIKLQFDGLFLVGKSEHETVVKAAQRDVVHWIEEIIERGNRNAVER